MRRFFTLILSIFFVSPHLLASPATVPNVDLKSYLGRWYEIKRIDMKFQKGCTFTTATYTTREDEKIEVLNECKKVSDDGSVKDSKAKGTAEIVDKTNSKLVVCFFNLLGWCPAKGDYWIFDLGEKNGEGLYSYAIVGSPSLKYGWVLSRTPSMADWQIEGIDKKLKSLGYDLSLFITTKQK